MVPTQNEPRVMPALACDCGKNNTLKQKKNLTEKLIDGNRRGERREATEVVEVNLVEDVVIVVRVRVEDVATIIGCLGRSVKVAALTKSGAEGGPGHGRWSNAQTLTWPGLCRGCDGEPKWSLPDRWGRRRRRRWPSFLLTPGGAGCDNTLGCPGRLGGRGCGTVRF